MNTKKIIKFSFAVSHDKGKLSEYRSKFLFISDEKTLIICAREHMCNSLNIEEE